MKKYFGLAAMALSVFSAASLPSSADAACTVYSAVPVRVGFNPTTGVASIYFRPHVTGATGVITHSPAVYSIYWSANIAINTSAGAATATAAANAVTSQTPIAIYGDAASCPAANANAASIGYVTLLNLNP